MGIWGIGWGGVKKERRSGFAEFLSGSRRSLVQTLTATLDRILLIMSSAEKGSFMRLPRR